MRNSVCVKIQTVPLLQKIGQRDRKGEPHLEICPNSLPQMFQSANLREKRKDGFNQHSVVPFAAPTYLQIFRLTSATAKTFVCQDDHFSGNGFDQRQKLLVGNVRRFHVPTSDESEFVGQKTQFAADDPTPGGKAFFADSVAMRLVIFRIGWHNSMP